VKAEYDKKAEKDLTKLSANESSRIRNKIDFFIQQKKPLLYAQTLEDLPPATHRFRVGAHRAVFFLIKKKLLS